MSDKTFTVILATFNRRDLLPRAIQSVLHQSFKDFELFVIDNGSTDDTRSIVERIKDERLTYLLNSSPTQSCDAPRNLGIDKAKGNTICFLDDDDIWYPQKLEKVKRAFDQYPDVGVVCHYENQRNSGRIDRVLKHGPFRPHFYEHLLYERNCLSPSAMAIKKEILDGLGGFDLRPEIELASDYECWLRMAEKGIKVHFIPEPLGEFSLTGYNGYSVNVDFHLRVAYFVKEHILRYEKKPYFQISKRGAKRLTGLYLTAALDLFKARHYRASLKTILRVVGLISFRPALMIDFFKRGWSRYAEIFDSKYSS